MDDVEEIGLGPWVVLATVFTIIAYLLWNGCPT